MPRRPAKRPVARHAVEPAVHDADCRDCGKADRERHARGEEGRFAERFAAEVGVDTVLADEEDARRGAEAGSKSAGGGRPMRRVAQD